jgi:hypothetical protein
VALKGKNMKKLNEIYKLKEDVFGSAPGGKVDPARVKTPEEARSFLLGLNADLKSFQNAIKMNKVQFPGGVDLSMDISKVLDAITTASEKMNSAVTGGKYQSNVPGEVPINKTPAPGAKKPPPIPQGV